MIASIISTAESILVAADSQKFAAEGDVFGLLEGFALTAILGAVRSQSVQRGGAVDDKSAEIRVIFQAFDFRLPLGVEGLVALGENRDLGNRVAGEAGIVIPSLEDVARA